MSLGYRWDKGLYQGPLHTALDRADRRSTEGLGSVCHSGKRTIPEMNKKGEATTRKPFIEPKLTTSCCPADTLIHAGHKPTLSLNTTVAAVATSLFLA